MVQKVQPLKLFPLLCLKKNKGKSVDTGIRYISTWHHAYPALSIYKYICYNVSNTVSPQPSRTYFEESRRVFWHLVMWNVRH